MSEKPKQLLIKRFAKKDGVHLSRIQINGLSGIQMAFENKTIWHLTKFQPFEYPTSSVFRFPLYIFNGLWIGPNTFYFWC